MFLPSASNGFGARQPNHRPFLTRQDTLPSPPPSHKQPSRSNSLASVRNHDDDVNMPLTDEEDDEMAMDLAVQPIERRPVSRASQSPFGRVEPPEEEMGNGNRGRQSVTPEPSTSRLKLKDSPGNPFKARDYDRPAKVTHKAKKPEKVVYVFRGKRITYDVPFDVLVAPEDPTESPFANPSPRLLFPPAPPVTPPASTSLSFLDRLRACDDDASSRALGKPVVGGFDVFGAVAGLEGGEKPREDPMKEVIEHGLPTPAREKSRKPPTSASGRGGPMRRTVDGPIHRSQDQGKALFSDGGFGVGFRARELRYGPYKRTKRGDVIDEEAEVSQLNFGL